jgi:hypothetical protein
VLLDGAPEGEYEISIRVEDLCGSQSDQLTISVTVEGYCDCGLKGDVSCDHYTTPLDVQWLVRYTYKTQDALCNYPDCPWMKGDLNCDYSVTPLDVVNLVNYVYRNRDNLCDRCAVEP